MSDTPRTDEQEHFIDSDRGIIDSGLGRQLERELSAANERIKRLEEAGDGMARWIEEYGCKHEFYQAISIWTAAKEAKP